MDSINENQPEQNHLDLTTEAAVNKIKEIVGSAKSCFFCTSMGTGQSNGVRPMSVQKVDDQGALWFLSAKDSNKNRELEYDDSVDLYFQGSAHANFLHLTGVAEVSFDKAKIKELWEPIAKVWFTEGENDPRITVIKFIPERGYYWDNKHGNLVAGVKMMAGAVMGKTLDDSIEGSVQL
jgi:general stress protein 26